MEHDTIYIPRRNITGNLQTLEIEDFEVSHISWTTDSTANITNIPKELPSMPPEPSFQSEHNTIKHSIVLQDAQIPQEAIDRLSSLLEGDYNSIISTSSMDVKEQIFSKWTSQPWNCPLHANHTKFL